MEKKLKVNWIILMTFSLFFLTKEAQSTTFIPEIAIAGYSTQKIINNLESKLSNLISQATSNADYLMEKNGTMLSMLLSDVDWILKENQKIFFENLSNEHQKLLTELERLIFFIEKMEGRIEKLEELLILDLHDFANRLSFLGLNLFGKEYLLMRIDGFSQAYQKNGEYRFKLIGNAFNNDNKVEIQLGEYKIDNTSFHQKIRNEIMFSIPTVALNHNFKERSIHRLDFGISVFEEKKNIFGKQKQEKIFNYSSKILLLPKYPIKYKLTEYYKTIQWSDPKYTSASITIPQNGKNRPNGTNRQVCVEIPNGTQRVENGLSLGVSPYGLNDWGKVIESPNWKSEKKACATYSNRIHDQARIVTLRAAYREKKEDYAERSVLFGKSQGDMITYGTHIAQFSKEFLSFDLEIEYFYGKKHLITSSSPKNSEGFNFILDSNPPMPTRMIFTLLEE